MTKNIIIGILLLLIVFFITYAGIKSTEAEKYWVQADLEVKKVEAKLEEAKANELVAIDHAVNGRVALRMAEREKERETKALAQIESLKKKLAKCKN